MVKNNVLVKIYGKHSVLAALENKRRNHKELITTRNSYTEDLRHACEKINLRVVFKTTKELDNLMANSTHQDIILTTSSIITSDLTQLNQINQQEKATVLVLDQVTDPQNIGAIIRSALAFGISAILLPEYSSPDETPTMVKASSGAIEKIPVFKVKNLVNTLNQLKKHNFWVIGLDSNTRNTINKINFDKKLVLVLGSEGKGLRRLTQENCDLLVKLPMTDHIESLNVSNAAAIAMYEVFKNTLK
jgi:23S rRNA (guanosine2251-2'-O)-methyltransferase